MSTLEFHLFVVERHKQKYLVIDCLGKISFQSFSDFAWSITVAIGYLTGFLVQDELYTFSYGNKGLRHFKNFVYETRRDSIKSFYTPVNANPYAWVKTDRLLAKSYYGRIPEISSIQLSRFCQLVNDNPDIRAIILLITESLSRSLLLMPAGLSVALEGLSEYFSDAHPKTLKPIKDDKIAGLFRKELMEVLEKYKSDSKFSGYSVMSSKIANINSPANRDKLRAPFTVLSIPLTPVDEEVLEYRNDFLHGNLNLTPRKGKKKYLMDGFEISLRLLTLLNMCIMKMTGYSGFIINHPKTQEQGLSKKIEEDYYRVV